MFFLVGWEGLGVIDVFQVHAARCRTSAVEQRDETRAAHTLLDECIDNSKISCYNLLHPFVLLRCPFTQGSQEDHNRLCGQPARTILAIAQR